MLYSCLSHQEALAAGMLGDKLFRWKHMLRNVFTFIAVQYTNEIAGRVIFGTFEIAFPSISDSFLLAQYHTSGSLSAMQIRRVSSCGSYSDF